MPNHGITRKTRVCSGRDTVIFPIRLNTGYGTGGAGGRASARETAARVAAGAVAEAFLKNENIIVSSHTLEIGGIRAEIIDGADAKSNWLEFSRLIAS